LVGPKVGPILRCRLLFCHPALTLLKLPCRVALCCAVSQGVVEGAGRLAVNVGTVALLGFGGMLVIQNKISVGALLAGGWVGG